jgi:signal transduction histidine kinase
MSVFKATLRTALALGIGILVAFVTIMLIEQVSHFIFPVPTDIDWQDSSASTQYMSQLPAMALILVLLAWCSGIVLGILSASWIARRVRGRFALAIGSLISLAAIANMAMLPHPIWFMSLAAIALPSVTFGCWWALKRKKTVNLGGNHE